MDSWVIRWTDRQRDRTDRTDEIEQTTRLGVKEYVIGVGRLAMGGVWLDRCMDPHAGARE